MKRIILSIALLSASVMGAWAQEVEVVELKRQGEWMSVKLNLNMKSVEAGRNETAVITPELRHGQHTQVLTPVGIYSYNQWYYYTRKGETASGQEEMKFRKGRMPETLQYETVVPYRMWMDGAQLYLNREVKGCCGSEEESLSSTYLAHFTDDTVTDTVYVDRTVVVEKVGRTRSINGRAFVDFPLSSTEIDPNYHSNATELGYLRASVDSVRSNSAWSIRKIWIKGYASPEGPYENNVRLARERTQAIKDYLMGLYNIEDALIEVESEPENWEGLRSFVEASSLPHRAEILEIIDGDRSADDKEWMIKSRYPGDYKTLLEQCLPFLRRTDYRIDYDIIESNN